MIKKHKQRQGQSFKMIRISGIDIPFNKKLYIALTAIFGIGQITAKSILNKLKININMKTNNLTDKELLYIRSIIEKNIKIEGNLKKDINMNIKRLIYIR